MKKISIITALFCFFFITAVKAQSTESEVETEEGMPATSEQEIQEDKKEVEFNALPDAVQTAFQSSEFAEWQIGRIYEMGNEENRQYEIHASDGSAENILTVDENGNLQENKDY